MNQYQQYEIDTIKKELENGSRIFRYDYVISIILISFKRTSKPIIVRSCDSSKMMGMKYNLITMLFGWWGFPSGPLLTLASLLHNFRGGSDCTKEIAEIIGYAKTVRVEVKSDAEIEKEIVDAKKMAKYSIYLGLSSIFLTFFGAIPGLIIGHKALNLLKRTNYFKDIKNAKIGLAINYSYCAIISIIVIVLEILGK